MAGKHDDQSVFGEPHMVPGPHEPDPSEAKSQKTLDAEARKADPTYSTTQSIYDEPDVFPGREPKEINQDWYCSRCGYNLRGLPAGHPCPECGYRNVYRPPPPGAPSYQTWFKQRIEAVSPAACWTAAVLAALCGGPMAVLAALIGAQPGGIAGLSGFTLATIYGPAVEETMKIAAAAYIIEVRPYLFARREQILLATVGAAVIFAIIENLLYLNVYISAPTAAIVVWRWVACTTLHITCTTVAARGLIDVWQRARAQLRRPAIGAGLRSLVWAIVIHGTYNALVACYELLVVP